MSERTDDDGVLDRVGDVVDVVLGEGIAPAEPEDPWERRMRLFDSWTAVILAIAAVATAWASFQASQWSSVQADAQAASAIARADAGRASTQAIEATIIDSQMWLSWVAAVDAGQRARADFLDNRFSPELAAAQKAWVAGARLDDNGVPVVVPPGTPFDLPEYVVPEQVLADETAARAEALLEDAGAASITSTKFVLVAVLLALVLFFASVATKFVNAKAQVLLTAAALVLLVLGVVRLLVLPQLL
jgi:hypothetical protein